MSVKKKEEPEWFGIDISLVLHKIKELEDKAWVAKFGFVEAQREG